MEPVIGTFLTATCQEPTRASGGEPSPSLTQCSLLPPLDPTVHTLPEDPRKEERAYLAPHVDAVLVEHGVDLSILQGPEQQGLAIELGPIIEAPHPHSGKVHPV